MKPFARVPGPVAALGMALAAMVPMTPAAANVFQVSDRGFVVRQVVEVPADAEKTWAMLLKPAQWWDSGHTWSGDAANLSIDPRAGGCFCEVLPNTASPRAAPRGAVEHMRVIYIERPRALRMSGLLGPLQAEAASGTLTVQLKPAGEKTQVLLEYVVGGYARTPFETLAPAVDGVLFEQVQHLAQNLGGAFEAAFPAPSAGGEPAGPDAGTAPAESGEPADDAAPVPDVLPLAEEPPKPKGKPVGR